MNENNVVKYNNNLPAPDNFVQLTDMCDWFSKSEVVGPSYYMKPQAILFAIQLGNSLGFSPARSLSCIYPIRNKFTLSYEACMALVLNSGLLESLEEEFKNDTAFCKIKRKGLPVYEYSFSIEEAKTAGLYPGKENSAWRSYPKRMLSIRAKMFAIKDRFPDVLMGLSLTEEVMDYEQNRNIDWSKTNKTVANKSFENEDIPLSDTQDKYILRSTLEGEIIHG